MDQQQRAKGIQILPVQTSPTTIFQVNQGSDFLVQVNAKDLPAQGDANQVSAGVISLPLNLTWNTGGPNVIHFTDTIPPLFPTQIPLTNQIVTDQFDLQRFVNSFDANKSALGLRGATLTAPIGIDGCAPADDCSEFSLLHFDAPLAGDTPFAAALAGSMSFADADVLSNDPQASVIIRVVGSSLSGFVYADTDNDGSQDVNPDTGAPIELGIPNVTISLFRQNENENVLLQTTTTGPDGFYHFEDLSPDTYRIRESQPECFLDGKETLGILLPGEPPRNGTVGQNEFSNIDLRVGEHGIDYLFGELGLSPNCINKRLFLTSTPPALVTISQLAGTTATVIQGTPGNDTINIQKTGQLINVTINGVAQPPIDTSQVKIVSIDAGGGTDMVTLNGTDAKELATLQPTHATLRRDDLPLNDPNCYSVDVRSAENVTVDAGPGLNDLAVMRDSPQDDSLLSAGDQATLNWISGTLIAQAKRFGKVRPISVSGGADTSDEQAHDFVLQLLGDWVSL